MGKSFHSRDILTENYEKQITGALDRGVVPPSKLIVGPNGSGKSAVLKKIFSNLDRTKYDKICIQSFPLVISAPLFIPIFQNLLDDFLARYHSHGKDGQVLLFIDDIDYSLVGSPSNQAFLRSRLQESELKISIIATAMDYSFLQDYQSPMYRFFGIPIDLGGVNSNEAYSYLFEPKNEICKLLIEQLGELNPNWVYVLTNNIPGRLHILKDTLQKEYLKKVSQDDLLVEFLDDYLQHYEQYFRKVVLDLPHSQRALLELGSLQMQQFSTREMSFLSRNLTVDAKRLIGKELLNSIDRGLYEVSDNLLKLWMRYIKKYSIGRCFNFDISLVDPRLLDDMAT